MDLKTRIKVDSITNLTDARYFAAIGADWLGFNFNPESKRAISDLLGKEIKGWLAGPRFYAECGGLEIDQINQLCQNLEIDILQTDKDLNFSEMDPSIQSVLFKIKIDSKTNPEKVRAEVNKRKPTTAQFIFDIEMEWSEIYPKSSSDWTAEVLHEMVSIHPTFLKMKYSKDNILEILEEIDPFGIEFQGGDEIATGLQAFDEIGEIIDLLEND